MHTVNVTEVKHYSDRLFSFKTTRPNTLRFRNGEFVMIGLPDVVKEITNKPIMRAYSIVSCEWDDHLEFLSIKVPDGPLTSQLQNVNEGDEVLVGQKSSGSLTIDYLKKTDNLVLLSTGTGIAPFMPIVNDPETYTKFKNVFLFHTVREIKELAYKKLLNANLFTNFTYIESVTREDYFRPGRFWGYLEEALPDGTFLRGRDSGMVCGSPDLNKDCRTMFKTLGWEEGNQGVVGDFLLERAFAD